MLDIPVFTVYGKSIAEAWENSLLKLYANGVDIKTQYDKPSDPSSKDCTMIIVVENPLAEPMIHRDFPGGLEDLQEYTMEVCDGIKDHLVRNPNDPNDKKWEYTYHERLFKYNVETPNAPATPSVFDQIDIMARKLAEVPYTRRAQAVTWKVWEDNGCYDPACLQSIWCRCLEDKDSVLWLNTNVRFRSNDAYKAAFMNMFALTQLQVKIAKRISELSGKEVKLSRYVHQADSYHLYGSYFQEFKDRFLKNYNERTFENRVFNYCDVKDVMDEATPQILEKIKNWDVK